MREIAGRHQIERFMRAVGGVAKDETRVYLLGGATAVLLGWRDSTVDVDIEIVPDREEILREIPRLKETLQINVELASPSQFIPEVPGWAERSPFISREGRVSFHHYDFYSRALAKIERGHERDRADVASMLAGGWVEPARLRDLFEAIVPRLFRYPAIDERGFRARLEGALVA